LGTPPSAASEEVVPYLSIVVPVYNGSHRLPANLLELQRFVLRQPYAAELLLVDDHSTAETSAVLRRFARSTPGVRVLRNRRNTGKGYSVARGMLAARGRFRVFTDADLAYPPEQLNRIVELLAGGADVAVACRALSDSRLVARRTRSGYVFARRVVSRVFNAVVRRTLVPGIRDTQAGLKGFTAEAAERLFPRLSTPRFGFDIEMLHLAWRFGLTVAQTPVTVYDHDEPTTVRLVRDALSMAYDIVRIRRRARQGAYD
jgi:dolichyl-phosphate beta-glucosyltransferase